MLSITICIPTLKRDSLIGTLNSLYKQEYSKIVIITGHNVCIQRNIAIKECNTDLIVFTDDDCIAHPKFIKEGEILFRHNKNLDFMQGCIQGGIVTTKHFTFISANLWFRTNVVRKLMFNENIPGHEDLDICWRALDKGFKYKYNPNCIIYHIGEPRQKEWNSYKIDEIEYFRNTHKKRTEKLKLSNKQIFE